MEISAKLNNLRISPRKVRLVVDLVRGMETAKAIGQLNFSRKKSAKPLIKLVNSAIANAVNNFDLDKDNLFIKEIKVDESQTLKRWMPRARGRATPLRKRGSHVSIVLDELVVSGKKSAKKVKIEAPIKLGAKPKEDDGVKIKGGKEKDKEEEQTQEKGKKIIDPRAEGKGKHAKIEGSSEKGFVNKIFRRKSG
jgi:large subunit ribosomal protein L22